MTKRLFNVLFVANVFLKLTSIIILTPVLDLQMMLMMKWMMVMMTCYWLLVLSWKTLSIMTEQLRF